MFVVSHQADNRKKSFSCKGGSACSGIAKIELDLRTKPRKRITCGEMVCAVGGKRVERVERMKRVERMNDIYVYQALRVVANAERRKGLPEVKLFAR